LRQTAVGVQKEQDVAGRARRAGVELSRAPAATRHLDHRVGARMTRGDLRRAVARGAVGHDDLKLAWQLREVVERAG